MSAWYEPEATQWDYDSEAYASTVADARLFAMTEEERPPTDAERAAWAEDDARRAEHYAWSLAFDEACVLAGDLPW